VARKQSTDLLDRRGVRIRTTEADIHADLAVPSAPAGAVVFAHGSGSGRHSPRNRRVAGLLQEAGYATLLLDLLTSREAEEDERTGRWRFDVDLLARRLAAASRWATSEEAALSDLPVGYFGASTGAAAALIAAAEQPDGIAAVVSRGGRVDLAIPSLSRVAAPTLLVVGERDPEVRALNEAVFRELSVDKDLVIVAGAGHLFEEPGALDEVARLAREWFDAYLAGRAAVAPGRAPSAHEAGGASRGNRRKVQ
jgi:putative phosphoribosyl transferase